MFGKLPLIRLFHKCSSLTRSIPAHAVQQISTLPHIERQKRLHTLCSLKCGVSTHKSRTLTLASEGLSPSWEGYQIADYQPTSGSFSRAHPCQTPHGHQTHHIKHTHAPKMHSIQVINRLTPCGRCRYPPPPRQLVHTRKHQTHTRSSSRVDHAHAITHVSEDKPETMLGKLPDIRFVCKSRCLKRMRIRCIRPA